jgi:hypothetical protein
MVLDCCVTIASTVISIMMNGICCVYQQSEEQKLREAIRQDIRSEYHSMYHQQQTNEHHAGFSAKPITSPSFGIDYSMDGEESVFLMSSLHIQEGRRVKLMKQKGQVQSARPINLSDVNDKGTNLSRSSDAESATCFTHNQMLSPFLKLTNQNYNSNDKIEMKEDDFDEEVQRFVTSSSSWTTISIV